MFNGIGSFGNGGSKPSTGFGQWYSDMQDAKEAEASESEGGGEASGSWRFWQGNEKKTDGATQTLLPSFLRPEGASNEADSVVMGMSYQQRFKFFVLALLLSVVFFCLAFFVGLPMIVLRPHKFALTFTLGSLFFMSSFAMLKGPTKHLRSMVARDRLPFSLAYVGSMVGTLYACLILKSYLWVVAFSAVQMLALVWYFLSFVPGGSQGMKYFVTAISKTVRYTIKPCLDICSKMFCLCVKAGS